MKTRQNNRKLNAVRVIVLAFAIVTIIYGALHGEAAAVLQKAASICLECIGIG